jgi:hypothetical protein
VKKEEKVKVIELHKLKTDEVAKWLSIADLVIRQQKHRDISLHLILIRALREIRASRDNIAEAKRILADAKSHLYLPGSSGTKERIDTTIKLLDREYRDIPDVEKWALRSLSPEGDTLSE